MFGSNEWGQLGLGHNKTTNKPSRVKALKKEHVSLVACGRSHTIVATSIHHKYEFISFLSYPCIFHTHAFFILLESEKVFSFGHNSENQLGIVDDEAKVSTSKPTQVDVGDVKVKMLSAGNGHSVLLTSMKTLLGLM